MCERSNDLELNGETVDDGSIVKHRAGEIGIVIHLKLIILEESTSRSQYTRAKAMLEDILIRKRILHKPKQEFNWLAAVSRR